jgi:hypothetical protein
VTSLVFINFMTFLLLVVYHSGDHTLNPAAGALYHRLKIKRSWTDGQTDWQLLYTNYIHTKMWLLTSVCNSILIYSCHKPCFCNMLFTFAFIWNLLRRTRTALPGLSMDWNNKTEIPNTTNPPHFGTLWYIPLRSIHFWTLGIYMAWFVLIAQTGQDIWNGLFRLLRTFENRSHACLNNTGLFVKG